ncbi:MAG: hypothetical protein ABSG83_06405 [Roseiarcus sp.]
MWSLQIVPRPDNRRRALPCLAALAAVLSSAPAAPAWRASEIAIAQEVRTLAAATDFPTREAAEAFLALNLPKLTAANPKYRSGQPGVLMAWITRAITFQPGDAGGLRIAMSEEVLEFRDGAPARTGSHDTEFSLAEVEISELTDSGEFTESGDKAVGIIFRCKSGKCIRARYDGAPAQTDATDISIQDDAARAQVLAAFLALQRPAGGANAP